LIQGAQKTVYVQQQYILAGGPKTEGLLAALEKRKSELEEIRIIVSPAFRKVGAKDNWELSRDSLDAFGLRDSLKALNLSYFTHCHNKGVLVDRSTAVVSSTNWSENSITRAREAGLVIESKAAAEYFASVFDWDWDSAVDESDLPDNFMLLPDQPAGAPEGATMEIHPADLV
jgi:phosphatidylserine/phosphatidylglycerophosphate/cardiolipin synthase-like enzyme